MKLNFTRKYFDEANPDGDGGSKSAEKTAEQIAIDAAKKKAEEGPNSDWKNDPNLDDNGNPIKGKPPAKKEENTDDDKKKADDVKKAEEEKKNKSTVDFNSPVIDQVKSLVTDAGLDPVAVVKAVEGNNGKITPAMLKALVDKHGEAVAQLVQNNLENFHVAAQEAGNAKDKAIYDQVSEAFKGVTEQSGADTWKELATWAKANIPDPERAEINKALKQGGKVAEYAVNDLVTQFKDHSPSTQDAELLDGDSAGGSKGVAPISKKEYYIELKKLQDKGHVYGESQEMKRLDQRRTQSMKRGM